MQNVTVASAKQNHRNLGQLKVEAEMMRGQVLAACLRGCGRLIDRAAKRRAPA